MIPCLPNSLIIMCLETFLVSKHLSHIPSTLLAGYYYYYGVIQTNVLMIISIKRLKKNLVGGARGKIAAFPECVDHPSSI